MRVLLNEPEGTLSKYMVAKKAGASFAWAHEFLGKLESGNLVVGTKVMDYRGLVNYWRGVRIEPDRREYMHKEPLKLLRKAGLAYALTTYHAESLVQHYLFPSRTDVYVKESDAGRWHQMMSGEGLVGKGNVRLLVADEHVFFNSSKRNGLSVVSLPQLIVDLLAEGGVCVEAAEKLLEKVTGSAVRSA